MVWRFIGEDYLRNYRGFVRVDFGWMADGLWEAVVRDGEAVELEEPAFITGLTR